MRLVHHNYHLWFKMKLRHEHSTNRQLYALIISSSPAFKSPIRFIPSQRPYSFDFKLIDVWLNQHLHKFPLLKTLINRSSIYLFIRRTWKLFSTISPTIILNRSRNRINIQLGKNALLPYEDVAGIFTLADVSLILIKPKDRH